MKWFRKSETEARRVYSAIDVGTTKVCTLIADLEDGDYFRILGVGIVPSHGMRKAMVTDLGEITESVHESVREAESSSGRKLVSAFIGVTGSHISSFNTTSSLALSGGESKLTPREERQLLEQARSLRFSPDRELLHAIPRLAFGSNGGDGRLHPAMAEVHIVTAATNALRNLTRSVRKAGVVPEDIILEPLASGEAVLREAEKQVGVVVVDIGGGTTDIALFKDGGAYHTAAIPVAGYQLSRDLAVGLSLSYQEGEQLKLQFASLSPSGGSAVPERPLLLDGREIPAREVAEILHCRLTELLRLVWVELGGESLASLAPAGLVFTGGTAKIPGILPLAQNIFELPCRVGVPRNITGLVSQLHDPAFSTSVGLLSWGARHSDQEIRQHHHPNSLTRLWFQVRHRLPGRWW